MLVDEETYPFGLETIFPTIPPSYIMKIDTSKHKYFV